MHTNYEVYYYALHTEHVTSAHKLKSVVSEIFVDDTHGMTNCIVSASDGAT